MTHLTNSKPSKRNRRQKPSSKTKSLTFEDLVVDGSLPRVKVRVYPSRNRNRSKPDDRIVVELQCEV